MGRDEFRTVATVLLDGGARHSKGFVEKLYSTELEERSLYTILREGQTIVGPMRRVLDLQNGPFSIKGGEGSGFHGHAGRPGEVGGSQPGDGMAEGGAKVYAAGFNARDANNTYAMARKTLSRIENDTPVKDAWVSPTGEAYHAEDGHNPSAMSVIQAMWDDGDKSFFSTYQLGEIEDPEELFMMLGWMRVAGSLPGGLGFQWHEDLTESQKEVAARIVIGAEKAGREIDWESRNGSGNIDAFKDEILGFKSLAVRGGPGSGHFGHEGRLGEIGGSQPGEATGVTIDKKKLESDIASAVNEQADRAVHGNTGKTGFFLVDGKAYVWNDWRSIPEDRRDSAIPVHSHSGVNATGESESFNPLNSADLAIWFKGYRQDQMGPTQVLIMADGRASVMQITDETDKSVLGWGQTKLAKAMEADYEEQGEYYREHGNDPDYDSYSLDRLKLEQFADKYGFSYDDNLNWKTPTERSIYSLIDKGGPGSGHFTHDGRPGSIGGSIGGPGGPASFNDAEERAAIQTPYVGQTAKLKEGVTREQGQRYFDRRNAVNAANRFKYRDGSTVKEQVDAKFLEGPSTIRRERFYYEVTNRETGLSMRFPRGEERDYIDVLMNHGRFVKNYELVAATVERGWPGSGHFGHTGREGEDALGQSEIIERHLGPGPHPSGSEQSVHAGGDGGAKKEGEKKGKAETTGSAPKEKGTRSQEALSRASTLFTVATEAETRLTPMMESIAQATGGTLEGLENSVKTEESLANKIDRDATERGLSHEESAQAVTDANRYTMTFESEGYVEGVLKTQAELETNGYSQYDDKWRNYFVPGDPYDGYNSVYVNHETGERFEVQFHTPETLAIKNEVHAIYKEFQASPEGSPERLELWDRMQEAWEGYDKPPGWETLPGRAIRETT
mgnify:FL=1